MSSRTYISSEKKVRSKKRKRFLSRTHSLGSFLPVCILSLISINKIEGHMWNCIIFYFLKKKQWNEMKWDENETLCWIMRWGWMTWKQSLAFNNDDGKTLYKKKQSTNLFTKKIKTSIFFPSYLSSSDLVHVTFPEMKIKKIRAIFQLLTWTTFGNLLTDFNMHWLHSEL